MFRIFKTTGSDHRLPPPILFFFLNFIDAFILKGAWTKLAFDLQLENESKAPEHFLLLDSTVVCRAPPFRAPPRGG